VAELLVPSSSLRAISVNLLGCALAQAFMVTGGVSGEEKRIASVKVRRSTTTKAMVASFSMS
jgi:hypothetical protein